MQSLGRQQSPSFLVASAIAGLLAALACAPGNDGGSAGAGSRKASPSSARDPVEPPFNVFVLVLDSCRADKIGAYGFDRPTMPAFDALARDPDAVLFRRHYAQAPATKASTASLFTGLLVRQHGVSQHVKFVEGSPNFATDLLDSNLVLLAEFFRRAGAFTFAGVKSYHLIPEYGFARGFDLYYSPRNYEASDFNLTVLAQALIAGARERFFGYFHLNACHHPFHPALRDPKYIERYGFDYDEPARRRLGIDFQTSATQHAILAGKVRLDENDVRFLNLVYEAKMRTVDRKFLAPILKAFVDAKRYDDTLIIVTADHGEELYEHLGYAHGHALWQEITHVPLVVKFPKGRRPAGLGHEVLEPTRTIDLTASLVQIAGGDPPPGATGVSILTGELPDQVISERKDEGVAILSNGYRLVRDHGYARLFRMRDDPAEAHDLADAEPERARALRRLAERRLTRLAPEAAKAEILEKPVDPKEVEALRALGYIQ